MDINQLLCNLFVVLLAGGVLGIGCHAVQIHISPDKCTSTLEDDVHISCRPDSTLEEGQEVTFMELSRNDGDPIAFMRDCSNISYGGDTSNQFLAEGHIAKEDSGSYLNVTLNNPKSEDTGVYTCLMHTVDPTGHFREERSSGNLVVDKLDIKSLETVLNQLKGQTSAMEENFGKEIQYLKEKDSTLVKEVDQLKEMTRNQSREINGFSDKLNYLSAFSASNRDKTITTRDGRIVILPDVIMRIGPGYDEKTGIFTAPRAGLYAFHAVVLVERGCNFDLKLRSNDVILARLYASSKDDYSQSSINSVVELSVGDRVFLVMSDTGCKLYSHEYTVFTGYLLNAY